MVGVNLEEIDAREVNSIRLFDDAEGREVHVRVGRFGRISSAWFRTRTIPKAI